MFKNICPYCNDIRNVESVHEKENINVRGKKIAVDSYFLKCCTCDNTFDDPKSDFDVLDMAYREYRKLNNMLQPEDIKTWRHSLNLTQIELSRILGFGDVTINRYESGKLQESSHDKAMKLAMNPANLLALINENNNCILDNKKRKKIIEKLKFDLDLENSFESFFNAKFNTYEPSEFSGHNKLNLDKVFAAIVFFCSGTAIFKTKLNKLLFYADFKAFKEYTLSITGLQYAKLPFGPVPDNYDYYIARLLTEQKISKEEENMGEKFLACGVLDLSVFNEDEIKILMEIKHHFKPYNASKISEYSHQEKAYTDTQNSKFISYNLANYLTI
jgi:putative zinc finger/helix-turn-helix YgiT family protein